MKRLAITLAISALAALTASSMAQSIQHPGKREDCSNSVSTCTKWWSPVTVVGMHGTEVWLEQRFHVGAEDENHTHSIIAADLERHLLRWAEITISTFKDGKKSTTRELRYRNGPGPQYIETCVRHESPNGTVAESHGLTQKTGETVTFGYEVNWEHTSQGDTSTKYRKEPGSGVAVKDASVVDTTRCKDPGFPFSLVRQPEIKPPI